MFSLASSLALLTSPAILFFGLGAGAAAARSDLKIPEQVAKGVSLYLMMCIGFKGGVEARIAGLTPDFAAAAGLGLVMSAAMPLLGFWLLRRFTQLDRATVAAMAATYGSVSVVTFAAGSEHLTALGLEASGFMAAVLALMETPAILTALWLMNRAGQSSPTGAASKEVMREVFTNAATIMLIGSFVIGMISGPAGLEKLAIFVGPLFQGALCFFLLDVGLQAAKRLLEDRGRLTAPVVGFAIGFPLLSAALALAGSYAFGLSVGDTALMTVLAGSASYIAVPAAMRLAAPDADPGVFVTCSLAITFPFNLVIGIPLYAVLAGMIAG